MLSATPVNNRFNDLRNQLALAYEGKSENLIAAKPAESLSDQLQRYAQIRSKQLECRKIASKLQQERQFNRKVALNSHLKALQANLESLQQYYETAGQLSTGNDNEDNMNATEFQTTIHNGVITLPVAQQDWNGKTIRVILLEESEAIELAANAANTETDFFDCAGIWEHRDIDQESIRTAAWRNKILLVSKLQLGNPIAEAPAS